MQIGFLNFYGGVLGAAQDRAALIANNIANADTPGFKAKDVDFTKAIASQMANPNGAPDTSQYRAGTVGLDGNDVSLDTERVEAAKNAETMSAASTFLHQSTADLVMALRPNPAGN